MSQLQFDADAARRIEALYHIRDAVRRRELVREALGAVLGDRLLDVGCGPGFSVSSSRRSSVRRAPSWAWTAARDAQLARARCAGRDNVELLERRRPQRSRSRAGRSTARSACRFSSTSRTWMQLSASYTGPSTGRTCSRLGRGLGDGVDYSRDTALTTRAASLGRAPRRPVAAANARRAPTLSRIRGRTRGGARVRSRAAVTRKPTGAALVLFIATFVAGRQGIGEVEAEAWGAEQRALMERDDFYFASTQFCFTATKSA